MNGKIGFNPYSAEFSRNPHPYYAQLREQCPVYFWEEGNAWIITKYRYVAEVLKNRDFSPDKSGMDSDKSPSPEYGHGWRTLMGNGLFTASAEKRLGIRRAIMPYFSQGEIGSYAGIITSVVTRAVNHLRDSSRFDIVNDYARDIPFEVIAEILEIPKEFRREFIHFADAFIELFYPNSPYSDPELEVRLRAVDKGVSLVRDYVSSRRRGGCYGVGLLDKLMAIEISDTLLTDDDIVSIIGTLILAGSHSTSHAITYSIYNLLKHPDSLRLLSSNKALWPNALQEVLRYDFFFRLGPLRYASKDIKLNGSIIKTGQLVFANTAAAHRDSDVFHNPDVLDVTRDTSQLLAFGRGDVVCIGRYLGGLEMKIAVSALFDNFKGVQLLEEPLYVASNKVMREMDALHLSV